MLAEPDPWPSPAGVSETALLSGTDFALRRGRGVHLLLQRLPGVPETERGVQASRMLERDFPDDPAIGASLFDEVRAERFGEAGALLEAHIRSVDLDQSALKDEHQELFRAGDGA